MVLIAHGPREDIDARVGQRLEALQTMEQVPVSDSTRHRHAIFFSMKGLNLPAEVVLYQRTSRDTELPRFGVLISTEISR